MSPETAKPSLETSSPIGIAQGSSTAAIADAIGGRSLQIDGAAQEHALTPTPGLHVVLITPFDIVPGDRLRPGRFQDWAAEFVSRGWRVTWITSSFGHRDKRPRELPRRSTHNGYELRVIRTTRYERNISLKRELNHIEFAFGAARTLAGIARRDERTIAICSMPPLLTPFLCGLVSKFKRIPMILDVHDMWPEAFEIFLGRSRLAAPLFSLGRALRQWAARLSDGATLVSMDYAHYFGSALKNVNVTQLGHPFEEFHNARASSRETWNKPADEIWATYIGTISDNYDLETVIRGTASADPRLKLIIVGGGPARQKLEMYAAQHAPGRVEFPGEMKHAELAHLLSLCDIGIVAANERAHIRFPKKTFDYLAAGLILVTSIQNGELEELVRQNELGGIYTCGDLESFVRAMDGAIALDRDAVRRRSMHLAEACFDSQVLASSFADWLQNLKVESPA